jgi:hypothetical protein
MEENSNTYKILHKVIKSRKQTGGNVNLSGYKGVVFDNRKNKYQSRFMITHNYNRINISLGYYEKAEEAYIARLKFIDSLK